MPEAAQAGWKLVRSRHGRVTSVLRRRVGNVFIVALAIVMDLLTWAGDRSTVAGSTLPLIVIPLATIAVDSTLLLRWRYPLPVFVLQWGFPLACLIVPEFQPFAGVLLALHAVAAKRRASRSVPALVSLVVPFGVYAWLAGELGSADPVVDFVRVLVLWLLLGAAAWGVGRLSYVADRRHQRLHELQGAEAAAAVQAERMRLARELHDIVANTVTIMMIQAAGAKTVLDPDQPAVRKALDVIEDSGVQAMSELHRMLNLLRMASDTDAAPVIQPDLSDLPHLIGLAVQAGREVSLVEDGSPGTVDPSAAAAAYRVTQEALTNAAKHGGPQSVVQVRLEWTDTALELEVTNHERGPKLSAEQAAALSSGHGLRGLRERVALVGGSFESGPIEAGYVVRARLPRHGAVPSARAVALIGVGSTDGARLMVPD